MGKYLARRHVMQTGIVRYMKKNTEANIFLSYTTYMYKIIALLLKMFSSGVCL